MEQIDIVKAAEIVAAIEQNPAIVEKLAELPLDAQPIVMPALKLSENDNIPCGCEHDEEGLLEATADGVAMLLDIVADLQEKIASLEKRIDAYNVKASHKI